MGTSSCLALMHSRLGRDIRGSNFSKTLTDIGACARIATGGGYAQRHQLRRRGKFRAVLSHATGDSEAWERQPLRPSLSRGEIHIWRAEIDVAGVSLEDLLETLAPDEHARAARFRFAAHRNRFVAARGILRRILGSYLDRKPGELQFLYSSNGKPVLANEGDWLRFSVSHAADLALYAVSREREVGVDVERLRPDMAVDDIAERYFSVSELAELREVPPAARTLAFFDCWTRKEAYVKALGQGLSLPLREFDVPVTRHKPARLVDQQGRSWLLRPLEVGPEYAAAVVGEGEDWDLRFWQWRS
jgi:4'-phosphopantetheinyl transferase